MKKIPILNPKIRLLGILIPLSLLSPSCEALLEVDLPADQINTDQVYQNIALAEQALNGIYANLREKSILSGESSGLGTLLSLYTDELTAYEEPGSINEFSAFYSNAIRSSSLVLTAIWDQSYNQIYTLNRFIEGVTNSSQLSSNEKERLLAEASLLRALYYQYLTCLFGDIPYTTTTDYQINTKLQKTPHETVLMAIEEDLKYSLEHLSYSYRSPYRIYPNKACAEFLLAKNYALQNNYTLAAQTLNTILQVPDYALEQDLTKVFKREAKSTLWQLDSNAEGTPTSEAKNYIFVTLPPIRYALNPKLLTQFASTDLRRTHWIKTLTEGQYSFSHAFKYKNNNSNADEYSLVFRLEEVLLLEVESFLYLGQTAEAIGQLNRLRRRANLSPLALDLSVEQVMQAYLDEDQREFFTEHGHRFFTLKRNHQLAQLKNYKPGWQDFHQVWPIPQKELLLNPNLQPQNHGY